MVHTWFVTTAQSPPARRLAARLLSAFPHLMARGGGRMVRPPTPANPDTVVTIAVRSETVTDSADRPRSVPTGARNGTSLTAEQLRRLQPGMWGQPLDRNLGRG